MVNSRIPIAVVLLILATLFAQCADAAPQVSDETLAPIVSPREFEAFEDNDGSAWQAYDEGDLEFASDYSDFCCPAPLGEMTDEQPTYPTVRLSGFFHLDATWFDQQQRDSNVLDDIALPSNPLTLDSRGFRRARLAAIGSVAENVDYMVEFDFAFPGRPTFMDLYFDVRGFSLGTVRVGQWRQPFGLGELTSVKSLTFHERASMFFLGPFRKTGVGVYNSNQRSTYAFSLFGGTFDNRPDQFGTSIGDSSYGVAGRLTTLLVDQGKQQLHIGAGYSHVNLDRDFNNSFNVIVPPEVIGAPIEFTTVPGTISTFISPASQLNLFNSEFALINGPAHIESELRFARFATPGNDALFPSFYAQMGYLLTGETRSYDRDNGVMGGVDPFSRFGSQGGIGAWELAARYSYTDLNAPEGFGSRSNNFIVGLNWYLNSFTKFQFNYLRSLLDEPFVDRTVSAYSLRAQVAF